MKKALPIILAAIMLFSLVSFAACETKPKDDPTPVADLTAAALWEKVKAVSGFGGMTAVPARDYGDIYGIDSSKLADSAWYMSENPSTNADECAIFKVSDASYADTLKKVLEDRVARQLSVTKTYSPEQAAKLENVEVVVNGSWVCYCVGDNYADMMNVINANIK